MTKQRRRDKESVATNSHREKFIEIEMEMETIKTVIEERSSQEDRKIEIVNKDTRGAS